MRCRTAQELAETVLRRAGDLELVSFDVFDTLLRRRVVPIERTKVPGAQAVARLLLARGKDVSVAQALERRRDAERALREEARAAGGDPEWHIDRLGVRWLEAFLDPDDAARCAPAIVEAEVDGERTTCRAEEGMPQAVRRIREAGIRTVFASDMYLGQRHIAELLERCGFGGLFDAGYVSSELQRSKATGRLFRWMLQQEGVEPRRWWHVGDNGLSDVRRPRNLKGKSVHYLPTGHTPYVIRGKRLEQLSRVHPNWKAASLLEMCCPTGPAGKQKGLRYDIAYWVLGPVFTNFIHRAIARLVEEDIDLVLFPAREAFLFGEIYDKLLPHVAGGRTFATAYALLTHKTTSVPYHVGLREAARNGNSRPPTLKDLLVQLSVDPRNFEDFARQCGLPSLEAGVARLTDPRFMKFVQHPDLIGPLRRAQEEHRQILADYLGQLGFWQARRVALVDIGWRGTVQEELTHALEHRSDFPRLFGLYMALYGFGRRLETPISSYEGLLYQHDRDPIGRGSFLSCTELLELATRAPHPTALGLQHDAASGSVVPVMQEESEQWHKERSDREFLLTLQSGILDFADAYVKTLPYHEDPPQAHSAFFVGQLDRLLRTPRRDEARALRGFYHRTELPIDPPHPRWPLWPEGTLSGHGHRLVLALYNLARSLHLKSFG